MSRDLVERLRVDGASKIEWEAADEIEWLRGIPDGLVHVLNAEIERLRAVVDANEHALESIERALAAFDSVEIEP